jgi:hypothetical protein
MRGDGHFVVPRIALYAKTAIAAATVGAAFKHETHAAQSAPSPVTARRAMIEAV